MGASIGGLKIDRYGDILAGYFANKVINTIGDRITVGRPLTKHIRNPHNYFKDLMHELYGMILVEHLCDLLETVELSGTSYEDCYLELAENLESFAKRLDNRDLARYLSHVVRCMQLWIKCQSELG
jgi:hypothetical protein